MDRRYYRRYENYDTVVPRVEDFPILNSDNRITTAENVSSEVATSGGFKIDDVILLVVLMVLLTDEKKDITAILSVVALLLGEYIF